jgi:hypothetical protein
MSLKSVNQESIDSIKEKFRTPESECMFCKQMKDTSSLSGRLVHEDEYFLASHYFDPNSPSLLGLVLVQKKTPRLRSFRTNRKRGPEIRANCKQGQQRSKNMRRSRLDLLLLLHGGSEACAPIHRFPLPLASKRVCQAEYWRLA